MLSKGVCPCLASWPIYKVKLQGRYSNYDTDDMIVFGRDRSSTREAKLIAQIKRAPALTNSDTEFEAVIAAAWSDFNKPQVFSFGYDALALITGPLSATDTYDVRDMLEIARMAEDAHDFFEKIALAKFSSEKKWAKLAVFRTHLQTANGGTAVDDEITWKFLKSFYLLGYDLDIRAGVSVSLLQSLIGVASMEDVEMVWLKIINEVQSRNPRAGVMTFENLPQDLLDCFKIKPPPRLISAPPVPIKESLTAALLGGWDENSSGDREVIEALSGMSFEEWQSRIRELWLTMNRGGKNA